MTTHHIIFLPNTTLQRKSSSKSRDRRSPSTLVQSKISHQYEMSKQHVTLILLFFFVLDGAYIYWKQQYTHKMITCWEKKGKEKEVKFMDSQQPLRRKDIGTQF